MHAKHWTTLLFAGCLSIGGIAGGQSAAPATPQLLENDQEVLIQPLQPDAPAAPQPDLVRVQPFAVQPPYVLQRFGGMAPAAPPPALLQVEPGQPRFGGGYRVIAGRQGGSSWMGVAVSPASEALRRQLRLRDGAGLVVEQVMPDSPADRAGIEQYDVLETLDDQPLTNPQELVSMVRSHRSGEEVTLGIIREGKHREVTLKVSRAASSMMRPPVAAPPGVMPGANPTYGQAGGSWFARPATPPAPPGALPRVPYPNFSGPQPGAQGSSVSLYFRGGQLFATIYDASGRIITTGPVEALRNQGNLPRDARRALEQLRDDGSRYGKDKPAKVHKHRQNNNEDEDEDDDAPRDR